MNTTQTFLAPAKINLFLHIMGKRVDGYHTLQTIFQFLDFYDRVHVSINQTGQITRSSHLMNVQAEQDLCIRAAKALQTKTNCPLGADINLEKNIPMGGGLGGGSSDAATILMALNHLWQLHLSKQHLMEIGLTLGADVPVFIFGQTAWADGIGEQLTAIALPKSFYETYYVVLTPQINVSTAHIFAHPRLTRDTKPLKIADFSRNAYSNVFKNDLEKLVCEEFAAVATTLKWLQTFGEAKMSGSGASVFVSVESKQLAEDILAKKPSNTNGFIAKGLKKHPHFDL